MALIDKMAQPEAPEDSAADVREDVAEGEPEGSAANEREDSAEGGLTPERVAGEIKMPPELQQAYERVVLAGMKFMFDPSSHQLALEQLQGEGPLGPRLGRAIAGLMLMLFEQSNRTMPPQVLVPAGTDLLMRAADFLRKGDVEPVSDADIAEALSEMVNVLLTKFGLDPEKVLAAGLKAPQGEQASGQPGGLINGNNRGPAPQEE